VTELPTFSSTKPDNRSPHLSGGGFLNRLFCVLSIVIVSSAAVLTGEFLINKIYYEESVIFNGAWFALICCILILCCFMVLLLSILNRLLPAVFLGLLSYGFLITVDIIKLIHLDNPLRPMDFQYLADLRSVARSCINTQTLLEILAICIAAIFLCVLLWRKESPRMPLRSRIWAGIIAVTLLISFFTIPSIGAVQKWILQQGIENPMKWHYEPRYSSRTNGLLVDWAISVSEPAIQRPDRYSRSEVERIVRTYQPAQGSNHVSSDRQPINLIIYLIESFMDPQDLGVQFTSDPIPTFHSISRNYSSGKVTVPVFGGTSANTEFELLTGLSMYFLPASSCPYRQYVTRDSPSLPRALHAYGYRTFAVFADPPYLFNRKAVLSHLGFDRWSFPAEDLQTPRGPEKEFAADDVIADAAIAAGREGSPYFIFAFTGGSHFPWDYSDYEDSSLDLVGPMPEPSRSHLKTYINSLNVADRSLQKLIDYFKNVDQKTAILVMGDHLPALAEIYDQTGFFNVPRPDQIRKRYQTKAVLWCNWPAAKEDFTCSSNFIAVRLLRFMELEASGNLALNAEVGSRFSVLSQYVNTADGRFFSPQAANLPFKQLLDDYRLIQYDLLKGRQYALSISGWQ
jgi:phosphoglycerol transferase MdoB-like AlkP superfamily enzyme